MNIQDYGFKDNINTDKTIARIVATHKDRYEIVCNEGQGFAQIKRGCYYDNPDSIYPTIGDFVAIQWNPTGDSMIYETLKKESSFSRTASTSDRNHKLHNQHEQLVAANFDYVFIIQSLNNNFNLHRIERYLSLAWESGGVPVIVLTKSDLVPNVQEYIKQVENIAFGVEIYAVSCVTKQGLDNLEKYFSKELYIRAIKTQKELLEKAAKIVKIGGEIVYSTCSILKDENEKIVQNILNKNNFEIVPINMNITEIPILPTTIEGTLCVCPTKIYEGFYVAKIKKIK